MKRKRHKPDQIIAKLREADVMLGAGASIGQICQKLVILDTLNQEFFADLREAKALSLWWKNEYNHRRPHSSLGYRTPAEYAASLRPAPVGAAPLPTPASADQPHEPTLIGSGT